MVQFLAKKKNNQGRFDKFWLAVEVLPVLVPVAVATFGTVAIFFLVIGQFKSGLIWPLGILAILVSCYFTVRHYPRDVLASRDRKIVNILVILGVLAWGSFNIFYTSSHILVNRDPALYSNAGAWLVDHDNLKIPTINTFGNVSGLQIDNGSGFKPRADQSSPKYLYAQGVHLLPAFIGLAGRIVGLAHALHLNVLFGVSSLLAIYAFGRALVRKPWWAGVATAAMSVSMPLINFSRDTYSEPLATTFTFGGLAMLWLALRSRKLSLWFIAGLLAGAGAMTRIDGYLTVAEMLAFLAVMLVLALKKERQFSIRMSAVFILGMAITTILGWLDLSQLSTPYYSDQFHNFIKEIAAVVAVIVLGAGAIWASWRTNVLRKVDKFTRGWRSQALALAVVLVTIVLISRPLWYHRLNSQGDPARANITTQWLSWYLGPGLAILGVIGITIAAWQIMKRRNLLLLASLLVIVGTSLLYLVKPSIFPDQIWASRRLLPVIMPGIALFGALALDWLSEHYFGKDKTKWTYAFAGAVSVVLVLSPLVTSKPLLRLRPFTQLGAMYSVCDAVPGDAAILWLGDKTAHEITQPTRDICNLKTQGYHVENKDSLNKETLSKLAANAKSHDTVPYVGIYSYRTQEIPKNISEDLSSVATVTSSQLQHTYTYPPQGVRNGSFDVLMGKILPSGEVVPLNNQ